ncbi:unnamed protein product, partial [Vitis vinifera]
MTGPLLGLSTDSPVTSSLRTLPLSLSRLLFIYVHPKLYRESREQLERMERVQQRRKTPSFSSSLLDSVLRSIDESSGERQQLLMSKKQGGAEEEEIASVRRAMMIEKWMRKQSGGSSVSSVVFNSAASAGSERSRKVAKLVEQRNSAPKLGENHGGRGGGGGGGSFLKTKSKALKFYGDLKKVNQPISPGRRIANFLNSLFSSGNAKKAKMCSFETVDDMSSERKVVKSVQESTCSSASSFSRSCLSKTPSSSRTKLKRSVRFYPVSVIVDEDCRPCGHKCLYEDDPSLMPTLTAKNIPQTAWLKGELNEKNTSPANIADMRQIVRDYQKKISHEFKLADLCHNEDDDDDDDDDDDAESYSSSDLFELDHIAIGRYQEELPVYGTTYLGTNHSHRA